MDTEALILRIPEEAKLPEGATFYEGEDDGRCRLVRLDGSRCQATRMRATGMCPGHSGRGGVARDPRGSALLAAAERKKRASARLVLGVGARRASQPLQAARVAAQMRAADIAAALVDAPLDDPDMKPAERHRAVVETAKLLYPQVTAQLEVDMPEDEDGVRALSWADLQALAASHFDGGTPVVPPLLESA